MDGPQGVLTSLLITMNLLNLRGNFNTFYYLNLLAPFSVFVKKIKLFHEITIVLITIHSIIFF